jgi:hypothetical protein
MLMRLPSRPGRAALLPALLAAALAPSPLAAQTAGSTAAADRGAYVVRLGSDTIAVESFTRTRDRLEVDEVLRTPTTVVRHFVMTLGPRGTAVKMDYDARRLNNSAPPTRATADLAGDTAAVEVRMNDSTRTLRVAARDAVPFVNLSFAIIEQAVMQARAAKRDSVDVPILGLGAPETNVLPVVRRGRDSVTIWFFGDPMHARVDAHGRLLGLEGLQTTQKVVVERVPSADVQALAQAFASRDQQGGGVGQLSPRDSVRATVGAAHLVVDYGRPFKRGRQVFGGVVPWGEVWRTGANAATGFTTDVALDMNGTTVPAGSYTLWTLPTPQGTKLIVNKQTGQWGTEYDPKQDLARIDVATRKLTPPVEQFTIAVEPSGKGGVLRMAWDDTAWEVPFTVRL